VLSAIREVGGVLYLESQKELSKLLRGSKIRSDYFKGQVIPEEPRIDSFE
jgi:hypothetical protein